MLKMNLTHKAFLIALALGGLLGCQGSKPTDPSPLPSAVATPVEEVGLVTGAQQSDVQLDREVYYPGDQIEITALGTNLSDTAWVGILPASIPHGEEETNDANDLGYAYLRDNDRIFIGAPKEPGEYDVRLNDNDDSGKEVASRSFKVEADPNPVEEPKLLLEPQSKFVQGSNFEIKFEAPIEYAHNAWVGIVPSETAHGEEKVGDAANLGYAYLSGRTRGTVLLTAPGTAGKYDIRMYDTDDEGKEVVSVSVVVTSE